VRRTVRSGPRHGPAPPTGLPAFLTPRQPGREPTCRAPARHSLRSPEEPVPGPPKSATMPVFTAGRGQGWCRRNSTSTPMTATIAIRPAATAPWSPSSVPDPQHRFLVRAARWSRTRPLRPDPAITARPLPRQPTRAGGQTAAPAVRLPGTSRCRSSNRP
jgi:hypothetical protein